MVIVTSVFLCTCVNIYVCVCRIFLHISCVVTWKPENPEDVTPAAHRLASCLTLTLLSPMVFSSSLTKWYLTASTISPRTPSHKQTHTHTSPPELSDCFMSYYLHRTETGHLSDSLEFLITFTFHLMNTQHTLSKCIALYNKYVLK